MIGKTVSHYKILEKLGQGGMGVVYKAQDTKLKRTVALKFLPFGLEAHEPERARFLQEAQAAATLNHPNICTVHDIQEYELAPGAGSQQFIVMEYVEGRTLSGLVPVKKLQDAIGYGLQICEGLEEAHGKGIVHRDIKTQNIMVNTKNQVKVMDFGLAKLKGSLKLTRTSSTVGTLAYMAPEQIQGGEPDTRTDIWSFGVVLYEILTGHHPFRGEHEAAILYSILNELPEPVQKYLPDAPSELIHIVDRTLEKDPIDRYQSMADLVIELRRLKRETSGIKRIPARVGPILPGHARGGAGEKTSIAPAFLRRKGMMAVLAVLALLPVAYGLWYVAMKPTSPPSKLVFVDIFENRTNHQSLDLVGAMAADWINQGLSQLEFVSVVPSPTASEISREIKFAGHDRVKALANESGATIVITGSYYSAGDNLQFQTQITDPASGRLIQALEATRPAANPMDAIEFMRQKTLGVVAVEFNPDYNVNELEGAAKLTSSPTYEAYREAIEGLRLFDEGEYSKAIPYFQRASAIDSSYAMAYIFLAWCHLNRGDHAQVDSIVRLLSRSRQKLTSWERSTVDIQEACLRGDWPAALRGAVQCAGIRRWDDDYYLVGLYANSCNHPQEALEALRHVGAESRHAKAWRPYWGALTTANHLLGNHREELQDAIRARKQHPGYPTLHYEIRALGALGRIEGIRKRLEESLALAEEGGRHTPGGTMRLAAQELRAHGFDDASSSILNQAIQWYKHKIFEEGGASERGGYARSLYNARRWGEAKTLFESLAKDFPDDYENQLWLGLIAARQGDRGEALRVSAMLQNLKEPYRYGWHTYLRACIAAVLGEKEQAMTLLRESFKQGNDYDLYLHRDMDLESLKDYTPFQEFMKPKGSSE